MRTVLICQSDSSLVSDVMPRWLASFSDLAGILVIREARGHRLGKLRKSISRDGLWKTLDLVAFRAYQRLFLAKKDGHFESAVRTAALAKYAAAPTVPVCTVTSPNSIEAEEFLRKVQPGVVLACCKHLLKPNIFEVPQHGTFVMHPGICPEYRNAHGCFWALVNGDMERVGMTLLRIDRGIDTGPVYGHFRAAFDEKSDTPLMIQRRMTYDSLDAVAATLQGVVAGTAVSVDTTGRQSAVWGQPTLSAYWRWKRQAATRTASTNQPDSAKMVAAVVGTAAVMDAVGIHSAK